MGERDRIDRLALGTINASLRSGVTASELDDWPGGVAKPADDARPEASRRRFEDQLAWIGTNARFVHLKDSALATVRSFVSGR